MRDTYRDRYEEKERKAEERGVNRQRSIKIEMKNETDRQIGGKSDKEKANKHDLTTL